MHRPLLATWLACLLLCGFDSAICTAAPPSRGTQLQYTGSLQAARESENELSKNFRLSLLFGHDDDQPRSVYWTLHEEGAGAWHWLERFGTSQFGSFSNADGNSDKETSADTLPSLLYVRPEEGTSIVPLKMPFLRVPEPLRADSKWTDGRLQFQVERAARYQNRDAFEVVARDAYGRRATVWLDADSRLVLAAEEIVFIGQGQRHLLAVKLVAQTSLPADQARQAIATFDALLRLRGELAIPARTRQVSWTDRQLKRVEDQLPELLEQTEPESLARLLQAAAREVKRQQDRSGTLASVKQRLLNQPAPRPELTDLQGQPFDWAKLDDKVTVLHFWPYRDAPLEEPYGQIAYLDFLYRNRKSDQIQVFGVAINPRLSNPATRRSAIRSVKRLQSFMNLSYPILLDSGKGSSAYGDLQADGGTLPLFVVIDPAGRLVHYHAGHYEIERDRGLVELEREIRQAADSRE